MYEPPLKYLKTSNVLTLMWL